MALTTVIVWLPGDMITRKNHFFPKYGVLPSNYAMPEADGFPQTFIATMTMALETGCFEYAHGVMHNCKPPTLFRTLVGLWCAPLRH